MTRDGHLEEGDEEQGVFGRVVVHQLEHKDTAACTHGEAQQEQGGAGGGDDEQVTFAQLAELVQECGGDRLNHQELLGVL